MVEVIKTDTFEHWLAKLKDRRAKVRITARLDRLSLGNPGQVKPVGRGVSELKIDYGPGYRVYFLQHGSTMVVLLCGGDKSSQSKDITLAKSIAAQWREENP